MKTLIVYYSRTGTTIKVVETLKKKLGADIEEIKCSKYAKGPVGYIMAGKDAMQNKICQVEPLKSNPSDYDLVLIGGPIWSWNVCPPVRAFCYQARENLKRVAFFSTMGSSGDDKAYTEMAKECGHEPIATLSLTTKEVVSGDYDKKLDEFVNKFSTSN